MNERKQLEKEKTYLEDDLHSIKQTISDKQKEYNEKRKILDKVKKRLNSMNPEGRPKISDHAIVRYMERIKGVNISEVENEILTPNVLALIEKLGPNGTYPNENFSVILQNNVAVTVVN